MKRPCLFDHYLSSGVCPRDRHVHRKKHRQYCACVFACNYESRMKGSKEEAVGLFNGMTSKTRDLSMSVGKEGVFLILISSIQSQRNRLVCKENCSISLQSLHTSTTATTTPTKMCKIYRPSFQ